MSEVTAKRILIVDDDPLLQELMELLLSLGGYFICKAGDGQQAMAAVEASQTQFDLIVLDLMMPVMDGRQFLYWLRKEKRSTVSVLVMSAIRTATIRDELILIGASEVINKPITADTFVEQVERLLGKGDTDCSATSCHSNSFPKVV